MPRRNICILLLAALFVFSHASEFQSLALNQGRINLRSLATTDSLAKVKLDSYTDNLGVSVDLGEEYLKNNKLTVQNKTDMMVILHSNITSFCTDCQEFVPYNCTENSCNADITVDKSFMCPYYWYRYANPINHSISIGNSITSSWKLSNNAFIFRAKNRDGRNIKIPLWERYYFNNYSTYGLLGLGVGGGAAANFQGDHPLFSVSLNSKGSGSLIFGKNDTLYNSSTSPMTLTTDTNWTMRTKSLNFGGNYSNDTFESTLIFDLQHPSIALPYEYWIDSDNDQGFYKTLKSIFFANMYAGDEYLCYYGNLTDLPDLVFGLENGQNITIPPAAYTRKLTKYNDTYSILISWVHNVKNVTDNSSSAKYTVIGWPIMSYFYTVFEQKTGEEPTITLYQAKSIPDDNSSTNDTPTSLGMRALQIGAVILILAVVYACFKNRAAAKLKNDLGEQLNGRASTF